MQMSNEWLMNGIDMVEVESTNIKEVGFVNGLANGKGFLFVRMHSTGATYRYSKVPKKTYQMLLESNSKGRFFLDHVKGKFDYEKLESI